MKSMLSFLKFTGACLLIFALSFLAGTKVLLADPTVVHLDFQDGQGQQVQVIHATLVLVSGSYVDKLPLDVSADGVDLTLDASWLRKNWPGGTSRFKNMDRAYVYLKAQGYASVCSNPIHWMGTETDGLGKDVVISFPRSKTLALSKGQKSSLTVDFRKPVERFVKVSGVNGKPLAGVRVRSYVYWSKTDDGDLNGADLLGEGFSDETGRVPVIDGDFTYALKIQSKATPGNPAENVLIVKRFEDTEYPVTVRDEPVVETVK
jgi:hypothetical protein